MPHTIWAELYSLITDIWFDLTSQLKRYISLFVFYNMWFIFYTLLLESRPSLANISTFFVSTFRFFSNIKVFAIPLGCSTNVLVNKALWDLGDFIRKSCCISTEICYDNPHNCTAVLTCLDIFQFEFQWSSLQSVSASRCWCQQR